MRYDGKLINLTILSSKPMRERYEEGVEEVTLPLESIIKTTMRS